ncbi:hypothetical protein G9P44_005375 [Scheffersomyces stipitis]|nr:hypothetical protein G9P44_005375 [Scheffersomyces stipitis]
MSMSSEMAAAIEENDLSFGVGDSATSSLAYVIRGQNRAQTPRTTSEENISISQRMISACSGSLITSLVVTPFDVIRIRIQQQEILPKDPCCQTHFPESFPAKNTLAGVKNSSNSSLTSSMSSSALSETEPFWLTKHYCKSAENCSRINSTFQGFVAVSRNEELIKTRLQSIPTDREASPKILSNLLRDSLSVVRQKGVGTLFTGLQITLWRDVPFSGIYWSSYEIMKYRISKLMHADFNGPQDNDEWKVFTTSFLSGSISGSIAAFFTNPFDVGKTRMQITQVDAPFAGRRSKDPSMFKFLMNIYRKEGMRALYAGFVPRVMKVAPSCAIMISSYEVGKKFFKNGNNDN